MKETEIKLAESKNYSRNKRLLIPLKDIPKDKKGVMKGAYRIRDSCCIVKIEMKQRRGMATYMLG